MLKLHSRDSSIAFKCGRDQKTFYTSNFPWNALSHLCFMALSVEMRREWDKYNFICSCEPSTRRQRHSSYLLSVVPNNMEEKYLLLWTAYILIVPIARHEQFLGTWCISSGFLSFCLTSRNAVGPSCISSLLLKSWLLV